MKTTVEITPKIILGYGLFLIGILLLGYTALQCGLLASGVADPLKVEIEGFSLTKETAVFFGIVLQIGMYGLLIAISSILMKTGLNLTKKT